MKKALIIIIGLALVIAAPAYSQKSRKQKKETSDLSYLERVSCSEIFIEGLKANMLGDAATAADYFQKCLEKDPRHDASCYELARIYADKKDYSKAVEYAEKAVALQPENEWYLILLANIFETSGRYNDLLKICQNLVKQKPDNPDYLYELANAFITLGKVDDAIKTLDKVEVIMGLTEELSIQKQQLFLSQGKTEKAMAEIQKLIDNFPDNAAHYYAMMAEMSMKAKNDEKAFYYYQKIAEVDPLNPYVHISLSDYYRNRGNEAKAFKELKTGFANPNLDVETKMRIMMAYYSLNDIYNGKNQQAKDLTDIMVKTHPGSPKPLSLQADFLMNDKKFAEARDIFRQVLTIDSSNYAVWENLLHCETELSDWKALEKESVKATELFPFQPLPYLFAGVAGIQLKNYEKAIKKLNAGVKFVTNNDPMKLQFYSYLGEACNYAGQHEQSDENYDKALKIDPNNPLILNNYAYYLSLRGVKLDKAEIMAKKAVDLNPDNPANLDTYGWVFYRTGKYQQARIWVEKAITLSKQDDPDLLEHLGDILFRLNEPENAVKYWKKAIEAGGSSDKLLKKANDKKLYE